jgi:hypothetical protein
MLVGEGYGEVNLMYGRFVQHAWMCKKAVIDYYSDNATLHFCAVA